MKSIGALRLGFFLSGLLLIGLYLLAEAQLMVLAAGLLLTLAACYGAQPRHAVAAGLVCGLASVSAIVVSIGFPLHLSVGEWSYLLAYIAGWIALLAALAVLTAPAVLLQRRRRYGLVLAIVGLAGLMLSSAGIKNHLTPIVTWSEYLAMSDGTRIAVSVYLPRDRREPLPAILLQTRYQRAQVYRFPFNLLRERPRWPSGLINKMVLADYAFVTVDVRGSGASFGSREMPYSEREVADGGEIVAWMIKQPWSNGLVGATGHSYNGTAAEMLLRNRHPAVKASVKAIMPRFTAYDVYTDIVFPGGIVADDFLKSWSEFNAYLDSNRFGEFMGYPLSLLSGGVRPVEGNRKLLQAAVGERDNYNIYRKASRIVYREDEVEGFSAPGMSPYTYQDIIDQNDVAVFGVSGWLDGGYPYAAFKRQLNSGAEHKFVKVGAWDHGGGQFISPCAGDVPERFDLNSEALAFFDFYLKGIDNGFDRRAPVQYYTLCANTWRHAQYWPPRAEKRRYYFAENHHLALQPPRAEQASDRYTVDLTATSGTGSRWKTYVNTRRVKIGYPERAVQGQKLLTYTSKPLTQATEVTGHPQVTLHVASSATDGQFFVYLEDIDPHGNIRYVTEGMLRALHRKLSDQPPPYKMSTPYRSYRREDAAALVPGETAELVIDLLPTSYLFGKGHRVRIAIAGADRDNFSPLPGDAPQLTIFRDAVKASHLDLPVVRRDTIN